MPTHFAPDNARDDDISGLPGDAQELYHWLEQDGADSRETIAQINQRIQKRVAHFSAPQIAANAQVEPLAIVNTPTPASHARGGTRRAPRYAAMRRWVTVLATAAVVIAFIAILSENAGRRPNGALSHQTPAVVATSTNASATDWTNISQLGYSAVFSANDLPAIAPSNPRVVYESMAQGGPRQHLPTTLRATSDGGATWRTLATPVPNDHIGYAGFGVSPVDPQTVFLSLRDIVSTDCPANRLVPISEGAGSMCRLQYSSFDGGAHWSVTNLPLAGGSKTGVLTASLSAGGGAGLQSNTLRAQGQRLFAGFLCVDLSCTRLVTSDDGGHTWTFADLAMLAHGVANICDYTANVSSVELYAVTTPTICYTYQQVPLTLWRSVDGGATWAKVRQLATPNERGIALTQNRTTGAPLLYIATPTTISLATDKTGESFPVFSQAPGDVKVSGDGGKTWQNAPTQGIPSNHAVFFDVGLLGTLSDGSIVVDVIPSKSISSYGSDNFEGSDLYAWKPGSSGWRLIGSVSQEIDGLLVTQAQTGGYDTIYAFLTTRNDTKTFAILKRNVDS